jgi:tRNA threonylcarbamoyladenosine biosynthesis protein TsaE
MKTNKSTHDEYLILKTHDPVETHNFGKRLGSILKPGNVVALIGDLAAGKTWLAKGIAYGLGIPEDEYVNSPAFDIVHEYPGKIPVYHMDFYRIDVFSTEDKMWIEEYLDYPGVVIIEWADKIIDQIATDYISLKLEFGENQNDRIISISHKGNEYVDIIKEISTWREFLE